MEEGCAGGFIGWSVAGGSWVDGMVGRWLTPSDILRKWGPKSAGTL